MINPHMGEGLWSAENGFLEPDTKHLKVSVVSLKELKQTMIP